MHIDKHWEDVLFTILVNLALIAFSFGLTKPMQRGQFSFLENPCLYFGAILLQNWEET